MGDVRDYRRALVEALEAIDMATVDAFIETLTNARDTGKRIFVCGNGGSAATASHFATDIGKGASYGRPERFAVYALTDSVPTITAYANDVGYDVVFAEQLAGLASSGDVLVTISGSGRSPNVVAAARSARVLGMTVVSLTGFQGGDMPPLSDIHINVPSDHMGRIEDAHMSICHMVAFSFIDQHHTH